MKKLLLLFTLLIFASSVFAQVSKTINLVTAGTLSTELTSNELNTTTNLTLSGNIDARDFKTMRDKMPLLSVLDLSGITVAAYNGTGGTQSSDGNQNYPANVIPDKAFSPFTGKQILKSIVLPSSVTSIGDYAFSYCRGLTNITIPSSVTSIGIQSFISCSGLTTLTIPPSVTSIGEQAFINCSGLSNITIPSSVTSIGVSAFNSFNGLITVDSKNPNYSSVDGILYNKVQTTIIQFPSNIGSFTIPSSVTSIGDYAFCDCFKLTNITIPSSVSSIGRGAFQACSGLTTLTIPSSVNSIGKFAFYSCRKLTTVTIPSSVTSIGESAFEGCSGLKSITSSRINPIQLGLFTDVFLDVKKDSCTLNVPFGSTSAYQAANQWKYFLNIVEMEGLKILTTTTNVAPFQGSTSSVELTSNTSWTAGSDQSWLVVSPVTGYGYGKLIFTATKNTTSATRIAKVTVSAKGVESQTITVIQEFTTGIEPIICNQQLIVYPNPTTGNVKVAFDRTPKAGSTLTVNDFTGKTILTQFIENKVEWIDLKGNVPGVYLIRSNMEDFKVQKVILK